MSPNGLVTHYNYDSLSRLLDVLHKAGDTTVIDGASYTYDNAGNRVSKTNYLDNSAEQYVYDDIYQLQQVTRNNAVSEAYTYDKVGNRLSSLGVPTYSYNSSNQLTSSSDGVTYTYDDNGNTLTKTDAAGLTQYGWDYENRLSSVTLPGGPVVTFKYDPFGRRIQKASAAGATNYVYDGANITEEVDAAGLAQARYAQGLGIDEPVAMLRGGNLDFFAADGLGSVTSLTDASGAIGSSYTYESFGGLLSTTGTRANPVRYTGREYDAETGMYYYRTRYYIGGIGRFFSEDSIYFDGGSNFYVYVLNTPVNLADPRGLMGCVETGAGLVCWDDGKPGGTIFRPKPPSNPIPTDISREFSAFKKCADSVGRECKVSVPKVRLPGGGNGQGPGPADFGLVPGEGTLKIPSNGELVLSNVCDCLKQHPLAGLDTAYTTQMGPKPHTCFVPLF